MFLADVLPSQCQDFVSTRTREGEEANCSYHPRRAVLVLICLAQGVT